MAPAATIVRLNVGGTEYDTTLETLTSQSPGSFLHVLFSGDALFALGCGRLFEGTAAQMWSSLQKLLPLPDETLVYCAHEYTQSNARFALSVEPQNADLQARARAIDQLRAAGKPTVPSLLGLEKATNPFLRPMSGDLQRTIGLVDADWVEVFARTRQLKDSF